MKQILVIIFIFCTVSSFGQTNAEKEMLRLSGQIFRWEIMLKTDSLAYIFHDKLVVVNSRGETQTKAQYLTTLNSGNFKHDAIDVQESAATVSDNTATVTGKGIFTMTLNGKKLVRRLSYMEVFSRSDSSSPWKLLAIYASALPESSH
jgi:hypothetical protein